MIVLITLDYELFLNDRTGSVENCLLFPTRELQNICSKHGIHYTLFVDAAYLYMLNSLRAESVELERDYCNVCENLRWIRSKGHDIELHIHPQWFFSKFEDGRWILDWDHYRLSDIENEKAITLFSESKRLLDEIVEEKTIAFRAGGYSLPGFDYDRAFRMNGIVADSSVLPGCREVSRTHRFDYRGTPDKPYRFNDDVCCPQKDGCFTEYPISHSDCVFISKYLKRKRQYMSVRDNVNWGDGGDNPESGLLSKIKRVSTSFSFLKRPKATIDYQSYFFLQDAYKAAIEKGYLTVIGHPKNFSAASMKYLDSFVMDCRNSKDRFMTIKECCLFNQE